MEVLGPGGPAFQDRELYPVAPSRILVPQEVRDADPHLADDYNQAVACEPWSLQASAFLLGRCTEQILVAKTSASAGMTLGPQIDAAIKADEIPLAWREPLKDGFLIARNQAGHSWENTAQEPLKVDDETVDHCFTIVDALLYHFYVAPKTNAAFIAKMRQVKADKT